MFERRVFATLLYRGQHGQHVRTNFHSASDLSNAITRLMQKQRDFEVQYPE